MDQTNLRTTAAPPPPRTDVFSSARPHPLDNPLRTAGSALLNWWRAATLDALIVGILWFVGLEILHVPLAPLWAILGALFQFIPNFGPMLALIGPALSVLFRESGDMSTLWFVLGLYGVIAVLEGLVIGPYVLHRTTRVPWWAAFLGPIVLGIVIPFWGVLLAPPLLAIIYAFRRPAPTP
ncbi:protein of unknown function DUF20 [Granulicella pectinivorans]|jgi:predicted PurR-regulated permease PerM|uniref:AI-2E family transporter n=1 Tax=Granulicella pectinivorans TaxID=474950 RepID=A0A1I6MGY9_9BACT|nr:AI-2E family transporter [Granulicella pectinivorans]SFS14912.1 protein of unknown function DUF20 [Granulicella pectinivorans]